MALLLPLKKLSPADNHRAVVRVDKTDPDNVVVERGTLTNVVVGPHLTHFDFTTDTTALTGCTNWSSKLQYYDAAEFIAAELKNTLHDQLHILAQCSSHIAKHPDLTTLAVKFYAQVTSVLTEQQLRTAASTSITGWCVDPISRQKRFLKNL